MRILPTNEQAVRTWVAQRGGGIDFFRVVNKSERFELALEPA